MNDVVDVWEEIIGEIIMMIRNALPETGEVGLGTNLQIPKVTPIVVVMTIGIEIGREIEIGKVRIYDIVSRYVLSLY